MWFGPARSVQKLPAASAAKRAWLVSATAPLLVLLAGQASPPPDVSPDEITVTGRSPSEPATLSGGPTFISPMGEPFRSADSRSGAEHWFVLADSDHDGRISRAEFGADALRFFAMLDVDHDGLIDPIEIERYETEIAPEVRVMSTYGNPALVKTDQDGNVTEAPYPTRLGAGRYGFLAMPEPVIYADLNFDRAVTKAEFAQAANQRFKMLDLDGDGSLRRGELPRLQKVRVGTSP
jgi:Ca2+-binding EF-hand superfamily protein